MPSFTDQEWHDIVSHEIPRVEDAVVQSYLQGRDALEAEEKKKRSDHRFRESLSPIARQACAIVDKIRRDERDTIWTPDSEEHLAQREKDVTIHPGMMFNLAKETMEKTKLWHVVRRMPKGALLHAHCDALVDLDYLFDIVLATPGMHVRADGHLATEAARQEQSGIAFAFRKTESTADAASIWSAAHYVPGTFVPLAKAAEAFPDGGRAGFLGFLKIHCTLSETEARTQRHGVDDIWRRFQDCFATVGAMIHYEPIWRQFLRHLMRSLLDDGIYWVEIRFAWPLSYCREGVETPEEDYDHLFQVLDEEVSRFQATAEGARFWGLRMIWTTLRNADTRQIVQNMDHCIATKLAWPRLIAGYDLVGPEHKGRPLRDLVPELFWFRKQCAAEGVELPFFFHAGECLGDGDATDGNLFDAVMLGTRRIGHGFSLYKHPTLVQAVQDRRILVESCPIGKEVLRLCGSVLSHPLPALLARGVACSLNNDDPAMLGQQTPGLTHDFWQALQGWDNLGLAGLGSLAENSVRWAAFEDQNTEAWARDIRHASLAAGVKAQRLQQWSVEWEKFCLWVVTEYGHEGGETTSVQET